jgi:hypothetical protein
MKRAHVFSVILWGGLVLILPFAVVVVGLLIFGPN